MFRTPWKKSIERSLGTLEGTVSEGFKSIHSKLDNLPQCKQDKIEEKADLNRRLIFLILGAIVIVSVTYIVKGGA